MLPPSPPPRFHAPADGRLDAPLREAYARDGLLVLEGFASPQDCATLMRRMAELVEAFEPSEVASIFSTTRQAELTDRYFLESGDDIRFFFEEGAFGPDGALEQPKALSLNKVGHALHDLDATFEAFSRQPRLARLVRELGLESPLLLQSMYIFKQPHIGGEVTCHQDATFLITEPPSVMGLWVALQEATRENGCLWALPGGHRGGLRKRLVRSGPASVRMEVVDPTPWPEFHEQPPYVPLEVPAGTLVVLHGLLPHLSGPNTSPRSRHAYALHLIDGRLPYPAENWLQRRPERPARGF
jgi:phytanoyl-CoA hydroxylase